MGSITPPPSHTDTQHGVRRVYLLTSPRTASNLFVKILNIYEQPEAAVNDFYGGYFFMPPFIYRNTLDKWDVPVDEMPEDDKNKIGDMMQEAMDKYAKLLETTEQSGKIMFVKEHVNLMMKATVMNQFIHGTPADSIQAPWIPYINKETDFFTSSNPTIVPDNILHTFQPTFLIRHPALQVPSLYRAQAEGEGKPMDTKSQKAFRKGFLTLASFRVLFEFYASYFAAQTQEGKELPPWPLVIDAADFITHPATIMQHFCNLTGFDFGCCKFNWDPISKEVLDKIDNPMARRALSTLNASSGIDTSKAGLDIDIDVEVAKWKKEFGDETASELEGLVRADMPDYEYLRAKRWSPVGRD